MALAITALAAGAGSAMLFAVARGTDERDDTRRMLVGGRGAMARLAAAVRGSRAALDAGESHFVLWIRDDRRDDQPNLSELRRLEYNAESGELVSYRVVWPEGWSEQDIEEADTVYDTDADFDAITTDPLHRQWMPARVWARDVTAFDCVWNDADPRLATLASLRLTMTRDGRSETAIAAAALRNIGEEE